MSIKTFSTDAFRSYAELLVRRDDTGEYELEGFEDKQGIKAQRIARLVQHLNNIQDLKLSQVPRMKQALNEEIALRRKELNIVFYSIAWGAVPKTQDLIEICRWNAEYIGAEDLKRAEQIIEEKLSKAL